MNPSFPYQRLGPQTSRVFGYDGLWLGTDHLLQVHNSRFTETYQRFDLRDIQAVVIRRRFRFTVPTYWLIGCIASLVVVLIGELSSYRGLANVGWGALLLLILYWLVASLGFSCSCWLQTAVDRYELPGLYRYRESRNALQILEARVAELQGTLPENWTMDEVSEPASMHVRADIREARPASPLFPALASIALLLDALLSWLVRSPRALRIPQSLSVAATLVAVVTPVVAIVVTRRDGRYQHIRILFLIAVFAVGFANYGNTFVTAFVAGLQRAGQASRVVNGFGDLLYWLNQTAEIGVGALGLLGLLTEVRNAAPGRQPSAP